MSRSFKKNPGNTDGANAKYGRRQINKRIRKADNEVFDGGIKVHKKFGQHYEIREYTNVYYGVQTFEKLFEQLKKNDRWCIGTIYEKYRDTDEELSREAIELRRK